MIRAAGLPGALQVFKSGGADAFGANKANLFQMMDQVPGSRVLDGGPGTETQALLIPKAGHAGLAYARTFIEDAKARGLVKAAIDRAGLRGAHVADRHEGP
jgi:polar amino acid transport system substrate-binding protein